MEKKNKNPGIAALLSFLVPGAGQVYSERIFRGIIYFLVSGLFLANAFSQGNIRVFGMVALIWIVNIFDAHFCARYYNNPERFPQKYESPKKRDETYGR